VLIKSAEALEIFEHVDTLVVDKTGTLTHGRPDVAEIIADGIGEDELLRLAASLERGSEHPLAEAIVRSAEQRGLQLVPVEDFQAQPGGGVTGRLAGKHIIAGNEAWLRRNQVVTALLAEKAATLEARGQTVVFVALDGKTAGLIALADKIKEATAQSLAALKADGLDIIMVTGDNLAAAQAVAGQLGIDKVQANIRPEGKAALINDLRLRGRVVAMAGDGVNDAVALTAADVGIAMATGTDVAIESAAITLLRGDMRGLVRARKLSKAAMRNIRQNLFFAFFYNAAGIPIAAGILYPLLGIMLSPVIAAAAMSVSSVSVIANSLRLRNSKL
jgi:Cu+-exporting ATPase